jgi:hypothetical protein
VQLRAQIITSTIEVTGGDERLMRQLRRFFNDAHHRIAAGDHVAMPIGFDGHAYALPRGRREIGPEVAAAAIWEALQAPLEQALMPWLQVRGVCAESAGRRILIVGESKTVLGVLAMHLLAAGIDIPSATGVCIREGLAVPYALPIDVSSDDLRRFRAATGLAMEARVYHTEDGVARHQLSPADFGREWIIDQARIDEILVMKWNPGGWSGFGRRSNPWLTEHVLASAHLPATAPVPIRLRMIAEAKALAGATPSADLHLGKLEDAPRLLAQRLLA